MYGVYFSMRISVTSFEVTVLSVWSGWSRMTEPLGMPLGTYAHVACHTSLPLLKNKYTNKKKTYRSKKI